MPKVRHTCSPGQERFSNLANLLEELRQREAYLGVWLLSVNDLWFRPLYLFFVVELASRPIVHLGVTRSPTDESVAQQLREATPFDQAPRFLILDRNSQYGEAFTSVAGGTPIEIL